MSSRGTQSAVQETRALAFAAVRPWHLSDLKPYPEMKESGEQWIGKVPEHWALMPVSQLGDLFKGKGGSKDDELSTGVPCIRYGDLYTRHNFFIRSAKACISSDRLSAYTPIKYGDLLFAASGETIDDIGRSAVNLMTEPACCGGDVLLLRPRVAVEPRFLGYAADAAPSRRQKARMGRGFTVVHIYASELKRLMLALPPVSEQVAIVRFLDHVGRLLRRYMRTKRRLIKLLEEQKQAIVHRAVTNGFDSNVCLKPSGVEWLGDVPGHWKIVPISGVCTYISYGFTNPMPAADVGPFMLTANDIGDGVIRYDTARRTTQHAFERLLTKKSRPLIGDVLITKDGTLGRVAVCDGQAACINQSVALLRPDRQRVLPDYLALTLRAPLYRERMKFEAGGTTIKHIYITRLAKMRLAVPSIYEQANVLQYIAASISGIERARGSALREMDLLREYRSRLIADVVTGKIDVRQAVARLPDDAGIEPVDEDDATSEEDVETEAEATAGVMDGDGPAQQIAS